MDTSHLAALTESLWREKSRLSAARNENERRFRAAQVSGKEKEIAAEMKFLGMGTLSLDEILISDDELFAELEA